MILEIGKNKMNILEGVRGLRQENNGEKSVVLVW